MPARRLLCALLTALAASAVVSDARAGNNDLVVARLGEITGDRVVGDPEAFRSLASELGVVLAPRLSSPADTLGYGGFELTTDLALTSISTERSFWRARSGYTSDPTGRHGPGVMPTVGLGVRKGIGFPLPLELTVGAVHLVDSSMWSAQSSLKIAIHEGYHRRPLPSLAVRVGGSRVMGTDQIDLTTGSIDVSISKSIGIGGAVNFQPFGGYGGLFVVPRSNVIDKTPHVDPRDPTDANMRFSFRDQATIFRNRLFAGLKLRHYIFALTLEANLALPGTTIDGDARDNAGLQQHYNITLAADF